MADTPPPSSSDPSTPPSSAAEQARVRKERREAKIRAGGSARLNKITGLGGGIQRGMHFPYISHVHPFPQRAGPFLPANSSHPDHLPQSAIPQSQASDANDPEEVDISQHFYEPATTARARLAPQRQQQQQQPLAQDGQLSDDQLRVMMLGFPPSGRGPSQSNLPPESNPNPFAGLPGMEGLSGGPGQATDDPMFKLLQQMMGTIGGDGGGGGIPGIGGMPGTPMGMPTAQGAVADPYAYIWRIVHAVFALGLGLYVAMAANFTGTKLERQMTGLQGTSEEGSETITAGTIRFFYIFATAEVMLQTLRFYVEKGTVQTAGPLGVLLGLVPQPWKGYLAIVMRYARIWTTTTTDALVCVFVLGACSWWRAPLQIEISHAGL